MYQSHTLTTGCSVGWGGGLGSSGEVGVGCSDLGGLVVGDSTKDAT